MATIDELEYYCREENLFGALMFTGKWGCGKTYLIENRLARILGDKYIIIRVSLFGEASVDSINKKVQKAYFQELMLNLGGGIEDFAKEFPEVSDETAAKLGEQVGKATEKVEKIANKANKGKFGKVIKFTAGIIKNVPGAEKIFSMNPSEFIPVENSIGEKKIVLVFDDLERSNLDEIDVLGCINEYCENKLVKTIIVANEEKILSKAESKSDNNEKENSNGKIPYAEIKEKIVTRTIKNIPDYESIIKQIAVEFISNGPLYKEFIEDHVLSIVNVFNIGDSENIRSVKCAVQDFQRVFIELKKNDLNDLDKYFQTFIAFTLMYKDGTIDKSEDYGYFFCDSQIEKEYPGYYLKSYMLSSVKDWLLEGVWNEKNINEDIFQIIDRNKAKDPIDIVRYMDLVFLDEDVIEKGLPGLIELSYKGELSIDEYIVIIRNLYWARSIGYDLPVKVDLELLHKGVKECLEKMKKADTPDSRVQSMIHPDNFEIMVEKEKAIYDDIVFFRENNVQMFEINRRKYLNALCSTEMSMLYECENKRFNVFDEEIASANIECYKKLQNGDKNRFIGLFKKMWGGAFHSTDIRKQESEIGFRMLKDMLEKNKVEELQADHGLKAALSHNYIESVVEIIQSFDESREAD